MSLKERIVAGTKATMASQLIRIVSKGAVIVLLTRFFLSPEEYGLVFFAISVLLVGSLFANLGLAKSGGRYLAEYKEADPAQIPHILTTTLKLNVATIVIVCGTLLVFNDQIAALLDEPRLSPLIAVGAGYVVAVSLKTFLRLTFQGFGRVTYSALVGAIASLGVLGCIVVFMLSGLGPVGVLGGYITGYSIAIVAGFVLLYTRFYSQYDRAVTPESGLSRRIAEYSIPLTATRGANVLDKNVDTLLVGFFTTPVAVGFYMLAKQISTFVTAPATSLGFSVAPAYGEQKARNDLDQAATLYETTFKYMLALYVPATVGILLVADPLIRLVFGQSYLGAVPVLQVFSFFVLLQAIDKITNDSLDYLGRARVRAYAKGATSVSNFLLNLLLIPIFGVVGAAAATVMTYSVLVGVELYVVYRMLPISTYELLRVAAVVGAVSVGMGLVVLALVPLAESLGVLAVVVLAGILTWALLMTFSGVLDFRELRSTLM